MKKQLILLMFLMVLPAVLADIQYTRENGLLWSECKNLSYVDSTAKITIFYPNSTPFVANESMTIYSTGKFYYNFSVPDTEGVYLATTECNIGNTLGYASESFEAKEKETMWLLAVLMIPVLLSFLFAYIGGKIYDDHKILTGFFYLLSLTFVFVTYHGANVILSLKPTYADMLPMFDVSLYGYVYYVIIAYILIYILYMVFMSFSHKQKLEEKRTRFM